ncbi:mandelate racemase/muconate lactonizing enzyme family protein [Muricoccus radiodurans]|uniref:mandelate racemase/muconate lactonizing enzyme family protein n=1 Tax=Muricoccus radiodurans TaxID=2231721 RepID=UPI003CF19EC9
MRIASVSFHGVAVTPRTNWSFLRVQDEEGRVGWGECTLAGQEPLMEREVRRLATAVSGQDSRARNRLARLIPHAPGGLMAHTVVSAFEQALFDLAGQRAGEPIHALHGGALREAVPLYANINRGAERTPAGFAAAARRALDQGLEAVKLAPFDPLVWEEAGERAHRAAYAEGIARVEAVREAIGPDRALMVDAHWRFSPGGAAELIRDLDGVRLHWLECPVSEANHAEIRRLRGLANTRGVRLAGAETLAGLGAYRPLAEAGLYDVWMPDIKHAGGHAEILRIGALALACGVEMAPHNPTGPVAHAHSLHLCAAIPNLWRLEVQFGEAEAFFTLAPGHSLRFEAGHGTLPASPGLGVMLDERAAAASPWRPHDRPWLDPRLG